MSLPDVVVFAAALFVLLLFDALHVRLVAPRFRAYQALAFRDRYEWGRRANNLVVQLAQLIFNAHVLCADTGATRDYLYGYSGVAHAGLLCVAAFYVYDSIAMLLHPAPPTTAPLWLAHHALATGLLLYNTSYKRSSAFPAATFLVSAAGHIPNEIRWLLSANGVLSARRSNANNVLHVAIMAATCAFPPPYLLHKAAGQLGVSVAELALRRMRLSCRFFFLLFYVPHLYLIHYVARRAARQWNKPPEPFRTRKVD